jgi:hypothetical protein
MSDSYGSYDRAIFQRIKAEFGEDIARLSFDVFPSPGSPDDLLILPKIHGARRPEMPERFDRTGRSMNGISFPGPGSIEELLQREATPENEALLEQKLQRLLRQRERIVAKWRRQGFKSP